MYSQKNLTQMLTFDYIMSVALSYFNFFSCTYRIHMESHHDLETIEQGVNCFFRMFFIVNSLTLSSSKTLAQQVFHIVTFRPR